MSLAFAQVLALLQRVAKVHGDFGEFDALLNLLKGKAVFHIRGKVGSPKTGFSGFVGIIKAPDSLRARGAHARPESCRFGYAHCRGRYRGQFFSSVRGWCALVTGTRSTVGETAAPG